MSSFDLTRDMDPITQDKSCDKSPNSAINEEAAKTSMMTMTTMVNLDQLQPEAASKSIVATEKAAIATHEKVKVKEKIVRVKKKFDVMNKKFKEFKSSERLKDNKQEPRTRSNSERSGRSGSNLRELQSISTSISTTSVASLETVGINIGEEAVHEAPRSSTKKQRVRNKKNSKEYQYKIPPSQICQEMNLNAETLLILDMLALPEYAREEFLMGLAVAKCIFVENPETHAYELNPKLRKLEGVLNNNQSKLRDYIRRHTELSDQKSGKKEQKEPKEKVKRLFEDYVNCIVQDGLTDEQKLEFEFPLTPAKQRVKNYFYSTPFTDRLEAFAQKCVEAQLGVIVEGEVRINAKNNEQAFVNNGESDAMFPSQIARKCALQGDIVRAFIRVKSGSDSKDTTVDLNASSDTVPEEELDEPQEVIPERSAKGFVIKIVEEVHNRECVGSFLSYRLDSEHIMFVPRDMKMPNIKVYRENWPDFIKENMEKLQDDLYVAKIVGWSGEICVGKVQQAVGKCGELDSENKAILLENGLNINPYDESINELFYGPLRLSNEEMAKREDLRSECIFTIDPLTARDLDDAMSCKTLPNGNYEIGVHISDVTYFVEEDSVLDKMIQKRTTSVYMVNEVFHMLPKSLCLKCSLLPGEDKLAFSVFWEFTPEGEVLNTRFCRSILNSCVQFAYEHAQKIIDNPERDFSENDFPMIHNGFTITDIVEKVKILEKISTILRNKRFDNGAIRINRPKLHFDLDAESGAPINCEVYKLDTANFLIEEFMLLANQSVAKFTYDKFPEVAFLRQHDPPKSRPLQELKNRLSALGLELDISSSKSLYQSFGKLIADSENPLPMEIALSHMVSKCMTRALYFCSGIKDSEDAFKHYALSIPIYTHFTSPIRRYPDVLVHRVLSAALGYSSPPSRSILELQTLAGACNRDKYSAKLAGDDSAQLYFVHYIKSKKTVIVPAVILCINKWSFEVILTETGHVLQVQYPKKKSNINITANTSKKPPTAQMVNKSVPNAVPRELSIFSEISVEIYEEKNKIKARLPEPPSSNSDPQKNSVKCSGEAASNSEQKIDRNEEINLPDTQNSSTSDPEKNSVKSNGEEASKSGKEIDRNEEVNLPDTQNNSTSDPEKNSVKNNVEEASKSEQEIDRNEEISLPDTEKISTCESIEEFPTDIAENEQSTSSSNSSEIDQELTDIALQSGLEVNQGKVVPILETLEQDFSKLQIPSGCPEVEIVAK